MSDGGSDEASEAKELTIALVKGGERSTEAEAAAAEAGAASHLDRPSILSECFELLSLATFNMMFHSSSMLHFLTR